jgi:hypothetical protein
MIHLMRNVMGMRIGYGKQGKDEGGRMKDEKRRESNRRDDSRLGGNVRHACLVFILHPSSFLLHPLIKTPERAMVRQGFGGFLGEGSLGAG